MNRKKSTSSLGFSSLVLLGIAVVIVSSSGIGYVIMKNRQISTRSQISEVQSRIQDHEISILLHDSPLTEIDFVEPLLEANEESPPENSVARR